MTMRMYACEEAHLCARKSAKGDEKRDGEGADDEDEDGEDLPG